MNVWRLPECWGRETLIKHRKISLWFMSWQTLGVQYFLMPEKRTIDCAAKWTDQVGRYLAYFLTLRHTTVANTTWPRSFIPYRVSGSVNRDRILSLLSDNIRTPHPFCYYSPKVKRHVPLNWVKYSCTFHHHPLTVFMVSLDGFPTMWEPSSCLFLIWIWGRFWWVW